MHRHHRSAPDVPPEWQPLVSARQWASIAHPFRHVPELLDGLRVVAAQLSPGVRTALIDNVVDALASGVRPARAVWIGLANTGHEVKLCSAEALGRLHSLGDDAPDAVVKSLRHKE